MIAYTPVSWKVRVAAVVIAALASSLVLGGLLSLFALVGNEAASAPAIAAAPQASSVATAHRTPSGRRG